ncbi:2-oxoglutarate-dependent dioxygenase [Quillaja saponaria]|uniref:2-oxoglutarate-dependent dioxygenase DAO n=1 Tax=Quillaja saponaria TaxID=32244 RepID=A0AAD7PSB7_QUISA|nr:2-oxoglutarate-dependent dioxygenase [Quillaja saponaria]
MGEFHEDEIPCLNFDLEEEGWKGMVSKVRDACETYGCLFVMYDITPKDLHEEMLVALKNLFDLPEETKQKHISSKPYSSYQGKCPIVPLSESFGLYDAAQLPDATQAFTNLMWPQGNPVLCETLRSMRLKMLELNFLILKMILESFGVEKQYDTLVENMTSHSRLMKYRVPPPTPSNNETVTDIGLLPHTDKSSLSILLQNEVQGLQVLSKQGTWIQVKVPEGCFVAIVGDVLKAWSNGRLQAARHRVVMSGEKERYSCGLFTLPKEETVIEVPNELVDKDHPLLYKPFNYGEYFSYFVSNTRDDALEIFASA